MSILRRFLRWIRTSYQNLVDWLTHPLDIPPIQPISENAEQKDPVITDEELKQIREQVRKMDMLEATIIALLVMMFLAIALSFIVQ